MALVAATVANDGELMKPRLVTSLTGKRSGTRTIGPSVMGQVISAGDAKSINTAMVQAVEGDLGKEFTRARRCPGVTTAGKSGTAELGGTGEPHSWFIGFAPAEDPKVAIAVIVEQAGRGGEVAAPIAGDLMTALSQRAQVTDEPDEPGPAGAEADAIGPTPVPAREPRPWIERIGLASIAALLAFLFGGVSAASWIGGEPFLPMMAGDRLPDDRVGRRR